MIKSKILSGVLSFGNDWHLRNENVIPKYLIHGTFYLKIISFDGDETSLPEDERFV